MESIAGFSTAEPSIFVPSSFSEIQILSIDIILSYCLLAHTVLTKTEYLFTTLFNCTQKLDHRPPAKLLKHQTTNHGWSGGPGGCPTPCTLMNILS